jgi:hypothetical protein
MQELVSGSIAERRSTWGESLKALIAEMNKETLVRPMAGRRLRRCSHLAEDDMRARA